MNDSGLMDAAQKRRFRTAVLNWYETHGRKLPWRESADPYRIWLSEIMLQQTTVAAVVPYFERFTARFPDVASLAAAPVDDVLKLWEGLGYYSRARNLHKAAQSVMVNHGGKFPADAVTLQTLPGVGRYTAGAIASFAFELPAAIVEANTERLYARLLALQEDVRSTASQKLLWQFAESVIPSRRPGDFNQSLMDIGSRVCRPQEPDCPQCPLMAMCRAFHLGIQRDVPVRKARTAITEVSELGVILYQRKKFLLRRRTASERWAGMWDFVRFEISNSEVSALPYTQTLRSAGKNRAEKKTEATVRKSLRPGSLFSAAGDQLPSSLQDRVREQSGILAGRVVASMEFQYSVTRYKVRLMCFLCEATAAKNTEEEDRQWFSLAELGELPLSATGRRIVQWLHGEVLP